MDISTGSCVDPMVDDLTLRMNKVNQSTSAQSQNLINDCHLKMSSNEVSNFGEGDEILYKQKQGFGGKFSDPSTIVPPKDLDELVSRLHEVFDGEDICVEYVQKLMTSYKSQPRDWRRFAKFDKYKYTRNLVNEGNGKFNLMILCWNEAQGSSIHSHSDAHCFMKVLEGNLKEEQFYWPNENNDDDHTTTTTNSSNNNGENADGGPMRKKGEIKIANNDCAYINDSIGLHRVENDSHMNKAVTLHLYSPPFQQCKCFDQRSGHATTAKMTFWSKYGKRTPFGKHPEQCKQAVEDN